MKAAVYRRYGAPDVVRIEDVEKPVIRYLETGHARGKVVITLKSGDSIG